MIVVGVTCRAIIDVPGALGKSNRKKNIQSGLGSK